MIFEVTLLTIDPLQSLTFEAAVASCSELFSEAQGCKAMRLERVLETAGQFHLVVHWETYDDHVITFRNSPSYQVWRSRVEPFFEAEPEVSHTEVIATYL